MNPALRVDVTDTRGQTTALAVTGELDLAPPPASFRDVRDVLGSHLTVILNLAGVTFCNPPASTPSPAPTPPCPGHRLPDRPGSTAGADDAPAHRHRRRRHLHHPRQSGRSLGNTHRVGHTTHGLSGASRRRTLELWLAAARRAWAMSAPSLSVSLSLSLSLSRRRVTPAVSPPRWRGLIPCPSLGPGCWTEWASRRWAIAWRPGVRCSLVGIVVPRDLSGASPGSEWRRS